MIKTLSFKNFYSFKDGAQINFTFDGNVPAVYREDFGYSTVLGIKGSNGSGKTNLIKAISFLKDFCTRSMEYPADSKIPFNSYKNSDETTDFSIDFTCFGNDHYSYDLSIREDRVLSEKIYKIEKKKLLLIERDRNEITTTSNQFDELKNINLKGNASVISTAMNYKFSSEMTDLIRIHSFFRQIITNVHRHGLHDHGIPFNDACKDYYEGDDIFSFVKSVIRQADAGIKDIEIKKRIDEEGKEIYFPIFIHKNCSEEFTLGFHEESSGTKRLFEKMYLYWVALQTGGLLALDEFDIHIHSLILPKVIELFTCKDSNRHGAQFIFTAHNTEILDTLGKYRTTLVDKEDNESFCYRLDEIPGSMIRNDRPISPLYLKGKLGGIPKND